YKNSRKLQELIWDKLVAYVNDFSLSNQEKSRLILRLFDDVKLLFNEVPVSILVNPRFYVSTSKSIIKALINMHSFEIQ
ncbi:TPA: hypothetical protein ACNTF7_005026, partial [Escherichia coli]